MQQVICYVDAFNLYHGLRSKGWQKYYWLDLWKLAEQFLLANHELRHSQLPQVVNSIEGCVIVRPKSWK
ncbi:MAG: hypothetical protein H8E91_01030 [Planctomycetes bacterium]|nr:hypothetical protein [Planctomycetota bacterium]